MTITHDEALAAYTDEGLHATITNPHSGRGYQNAAEYLLLLPNDPQLRYDIVGEAHIAQNVSGGIYSGVVYTQVRRWLNGGRGFPYREANRAMLAREEAARDPRTGPVLEPIEVAFAHLI